MSSFANRIVSEDGHSELRTKTSAGIAEVVAATAKARILHHPHLKAQRIWCEFDGGNLLLRGQVPSFFFKQLAQQAMLGLDNVRQVVNEIEVVW
jgi:osmotically-inducible protein OsmY